MTTGAERIFVDSNVLLGCTDENRAVHQASVTFIEAAIQGKYRLYANSQVFREYFVVTTRPQAENGLGLSPDESCRNMRIFRESVQILGEGTEVLNELARLVKLYELKGKRIHDANLVAVMNMNGLRHLKTWNPGDFSPFGDLVLV